MVKVRARHYSTHKGRRLVESKKILSVVTLVLEFISIVIFRLCVIWRISGGDHHQKKALNFKVIVLFDLDNVKIRQYQETTHVFTFNKYPEYHLQFYHLRHTYFRKCMQQNDTLESKTNQ